MNIKKVIVGELDTNCYIIENDSECLIIDPGSDANKIKNNIDKKVVGILITHRHFDHIGALDKLVSFYDTTIYDKSNLNSGKNKVGSFEFIVNYFPGHTMDSICFIFGDIMFCGDFIFKNGVGRCDLGGDFNLMKDSINKILESNINYKLYPGHGEETDLDSERNNLSLYI